jgi:hypothetical protein
VLGRRGSKEPQIAGSRILRGDAIGTGAFVIATTAGMVSRSWMGLTAVVSVVLFMIGMAAMLMAFARAVQRSRTEAIGMGGLYFLAGDAAPGVIRRPFNVLLAVQVIVGFVGAGSRLYSAMATCVLVPVFGIGMAGLWGSRFGAFAARPQAKGGGSTGEKPSKARGGLADRPE